MNFHERSKARMNLAAIKRVDPYAKNIVSTSTHVAFYTFSVKQDEWEKPDVEGAFFVYSRNVQPFHSLLIINRINTSSFVEPITTHLQVRSQPPILMYRNERCHIRGLRFSNVGECVRISSIVTNLIQKVNLPPMLRDSTKKTQKPKQKDAKIGAMLSVAQQEYAHNTQQKFASGKKTKFFAAPNFKATEARLFLQRKLPNMLTVKQVEKQQLRLHLLKSKVSTNCYLNQIQKYCD